MFDIVYHKRAIKQLIKLPKGEREKIAKKIEQLKNNPFDFNKLNIKRLAGTKNSWRVRAGNLRAIYNVIKDKNIIYIRYLGYRGSIYK